MKVDFSKLNLNSRPTLILENTSNTPVGVLGYANNVSLDLKYNEASMIEFEIPKSVEGVQTPHYDRVIGLRQVCLQDVGRFILVNPVESGDGVKTIKSCKGYSLEYEFTFKKITIPTGTYNFWNPLAQEDTLIGMILEVMPSWRIGSVDPTLYGKYRTFEVNNENVYNFIKNTVQKSYNCIFEFDPFERVINVRDANSIPIVKPMILSYNNLLSSIKVEEDTEGLATRIDVHGAEGVDIRDVNPTGTNYMVNLNHYMTTDNFDEALIEKYKNWEAECSGAQLEYYNLSIEYVLLVMRKASESAKLTTLQNELTDLENQQAVAIQGGSDITSINGNITNKVTEINNKKAEIQNIEDEMRSLYAALSSINEKLRMDKYFTEDEFCLLDRYLIDGEISESSFVATTTNAYSDADYGNGFKNGTITLYNPNVTKVVNDGAAHTTYMIRQGTLTINGATSDILCGEIVRMTVEVFDDGELILTGYVRNGKIDDNTFGNGCIYLSSNVSDGTDLIGGVNNVNDTLTRLIDPGVTEYDGALQVGESYLYFTKDVTEYEKRAVQWDLYEYAQQILDKVSTPSYSFKVSSANFLDLEEFVSFKNQLAIGDKLYLTLDEEQTITPICIGVKASYSDNSLVLEFGDTYTSNDSSFKLADLLEQSVSMGKNVDISKYTYSAFVDSGASTEVRNFMNSALDVSKNAILSSKNQAISWSDSGIRLRKWTDETQAKYDDCQMWMNNNSILITKDNWNSAEVAIGQFEDPNFGKCYGIIAPNIVGTLLAGENLIIESAKKDGDTAAFRVDGDGCKLYNSTFEIMKGDTLISLNPDIGIAIGKTSGESPLYTYSEDEEGNITCTFNANNANFYIDNDGNVRFKGILEGASGNFTGSITAEEGYIGYKDEFNTGWEITFGAIRNRKTGLDDYTNQGIYVGTDGIHVGSSASSHFRVDTSGSITATNATITGRLTANGVIGGSENGWRVANSAIYYNRQNFSIMDKTEGIYIGIDGISTYGYNASYGWGAVTIGADGSLFASGYTCAQGQFCIASGSTIGGTATFDQNGMYSVSGGFSVGDHSIWCMRYNESYPQYGYLYIGYGVLAGASGDVNASRIQADIFQGALYGEVVTSSDQSAKNNISALSASYDTLFDSLRPSTFKYNDGTSGRTHVGFIAQEVNDAILSAGLTTQDFAGFVINKTEDSELWMLRYDEFVALNTQQIQKLKARVTELENKIASLTAEA